MSCEQCKTPKIEPRWNYCPNCGIKIEAWQQAQAGHLMELELTGKCSCAPGTHDEPLD